MSNAPSDPSPPLLALPAPGDDSTTKLEVGGSSIKIDALGPLVVNSDGTLSRISNWNEMNEFERERILRVLNARNQQRLKKEREKLAAAQDTEALGRAEATNTDQSAS